MVSCFDRLVDIQNFTVFANIVGPTAREAGGTEAAKRFCDLFARVAQNRVIQIQALGKLSVSFNWINAGGEVCDVELANGLAALTERLAFLRSAAGERFWVPGDDKGFLPFEVFVAVCFSVAADHLEIGNVVTDIDLCVC